MSSMRRLRRSHLLSFLIFTIIVAAAAYLAWPNQAAAPSPKSQISSNSNPGTAGFDKNQLSTTNPASFWIVVNKKHSLAPINYAPADLTTPSVPLRVPGNESMQLRSAASGALEQMFAGAKAAGLSLMLSSGYRSYNYQVGLYNSYVRTEGQTAADKSSARPGHSEHQTGLAADIEPTSRQCELNACFADTPEGKWLTANSYQYGFILRYQPDNVAVTGYESEPWHFRYVGKELAAELHSKNITTLEEFFGISGGQSY
jgi:zinc D-Ala-D-Ala carboxypeptidase